VRAVANSNGHVVARTDHQAFGEEIGVGVGLRKIEQGYSADKATRQGYGLTENHTATGQQHTWFRKLETQAGRWTSPDPYKGSMNIGDPQSFNRYSYVSNEPTNFVDPSGLMQMCFYEPWTVCVDGSCETTYELSFCIGGGGGWGWGPVEIPIELPPGGVPGGGGGGVGGSTAQSMTSECLDKLNALLKTLLGEKAFAKLTNRETQASGFEALMANFLLAGRVIGVIGGNSNYNPGTGIITMNIDPSRGEGFAGAWVATQRLELIHELLHGARPSGFSHRDIYKAMADVDGLDFRKFSKDREKELKAQGAKKNDDSMYRDEMNRWIRKYCE